MKADSPRVIGTAGHVDHGKSSLVKALTGIDPDRLQEEKARQMTIDLGFAWLKLPSGQEVSIVDVPGHEDFIKNMLAGVGGIDVALLVVAADEGVMPQTREHLAILDLLGVQSGVIALTKQDLVDAEWLALVMEELREELAGTCLQNAPILPVSSRTGYGLDELKAELALAVAKAPPRRDLGQPRLPIDRVFHLSGFGTVVTGTLTDGRLRVGQEVEILPEGLRSRIRGLQAHKRRIEEALPGSRVAVNLVGVSTDQLQRGDVVAAVGQFSSTRLLDVHLRLLKSAPKSLRHNSEVDFYTGASVVSARVRLLGQETLERGAEAFAQLVLLAPLVAMKGDRFVIRQPSPSLTIGGGSVVDPFPARRHRRFRPEVISHLEKLLQGSPEEILLESLHRPRQAAELLKIAAASCRLRLDAAEETLSRLLADGQVIALGGMGDLRNSRGFQSLGSLYLLSASSWQEWKDHVAELLANYHRAHPLRGGMPRSELRSQLHIHPGLFNDLIAQALKEGAVAETANGDIRRRDHAIRFTSEQQAQISALLADFAAAPYAPPSVAECEARVGAEVLAALYGGEASETSEISEARVLVRVSREVLFLRSTYEEMVQRITAHLRTHGAITLAQVRDMFATSRKYAAALLEYLDSQRITRRVGDEHVLRSV